MWRLLQNIAKEDEHGLCLGTNDFFRPDLKQIGNSLNEIRSYFIQKDAQNIVPKDLRTPLAQVKERLVEHIANHAFDFGFDPLASEEVGFPNPKAGFMFLAHSLSVVLDFPTSPRPSHTVCDVFLALPTQPVIVLSLLDVDAVCPEAVMYNTSVARGVIETLSRFTDEDVNSIHGVIPRSILENAASFKTRLKKLANDSSHFVTRDSLVMTPSRYEKVLTAFWAGVAETKSVLKETGDTDGDCLRFLTKEQCIILVENINNKVVQVKCVPGRGATTLMLEVARRLNRQGDTLLVCRSREERDRLRSVYPSAVAAEDLSAVDLSSCVNIVDETNTVMTHASSRKWQFGTNGTDIKERTSQTCEAEREKEGMEKQKDVLSDDFGSAVPIVGLTCQPKLVSRPKLHLDAARANTRCCHVTTEGELVNSPPDTRDEGRNRLQTYWGTCSSPIPLPPPSSTLTLLPTTPTYWETKTRVRVLREGGLYVLEMGVSEAGQVDSEWWVSLQPRSWCVRVESCVRHGGSLCTAVCRERERGECHQNTMSRTRGTQATLHYGVVLDVGRGRVAFIDLDRGIVLVKYDEVFLEPLVPMFSAGFSLSGYTVSMSLISGEDVDMTDTKRALVYQALR